MKCFGSDFHNCLSRCTWSRHFFRYFESFPFVPKRKQFLSQCAEKLLTVPLSDTNHFKVLFKVSGAIPRLDGDFVGTGNEKDISSIVMSIFARKRMAERNNQNVEFHSVLVGKAAKTVSV